jgi:hypothetical protein
MKAMKAMKARGWVSHGSSPCWFQLFSSKIAGRCGKFMDHPPHSTMVGVIGFHLPAQQFWGMNPYKSQLFWCEQQGLTHVFLIIDSHMSIVPPEGD